MKKLIQRAVSLVAAAVMILSPAAFAFSAGVAPSAPEGYDQHDYEKAVAFLEQTDSYGVKNGEKVSAAYDPLDPESWNYPGDRFAWTPVSGVLKLASVNCGSLSGRLAGALDLSGCTALTLVDCSSSVLTSADLSGCEALDTLILKNGSLESISLAGCASLRLLNCANNHLAALGLSDCPALRFLECRWNQITELDLSSCPELTVLICTDNRLKTLDLTGNPLLGPVKFLRMADEDVQYISCFIAEDPEYTNTPEYFISADCYGSCSSFGCWYTEDGRPVSDMPVFTPAPGFGGRFVARYELDGTQPGDADGSGDVGISDALMILRAAMSLIQHPTTASFDVNGDHEVTFDDAILVLRRAVGLFGAA